MDSSGRSACCGLCSRDRRRQEPRPRAVVQVVASVRAERPRRTTDSRRANQALLRFEPAKRDRSSRVPPNVGHRQPPTVGRPNLTVRTQSQAVVERLFPKGPPRSLQIGALPSASFLAGFPSVSMSGMSNVQKWRLRQLNALPGRQSARRVLRCGDRSPHSWVVIAVGRYWLSRAYGR
jgi:hypothetical protein